MIRRLLFSSAILVIFTGCNAVSLIQKPVILNSDETQLESRQYQTKKYTVDSATLMKSLIETLQDDNYIIRHSDNQNGIVTASKIKEDVKLELTARIKRVRGGVCALRFNIQLLESNVFGAERQSYLRPKYYAYLFSRIEKSIFLQKNLYGRTAQRSQTETQSYGSHGYAPAQSMDVESYDYPNSMRQYYGF